MKTTTKVVSDPEPEEEEQEYLKYIIKDCTFNITVEEGGTVIFQTGKPSGPIVPPKP